MVHVRPFAPGDTTAVAAVIVPIQQGEFAVPVTLEDQPDLGDVPGFYQRGTGNFWVAEAGGRIVGTIGLLDIGNGEAALRKMFVVQRFRGKERGVARRLLDVLVGWAASQAIAVIYLGTTDEFRAAHRFYEKNGFDQIPRSELPEAFPVMAVDSRFYRRVLPLARTG